MEWMSIVLVVVPVVVLVVWWRRRLAVVRGARTAVPGRVTVPQVPLGVDQVLGAVELSPLVGPGIPLCQAGGQVIGVPLEADTGHVAVIAPTRAGKGLHATEVLLRWPGAAIVIDPKGELYARTAGTRIADGHVVTIPSAALDLLDYYDVHNPLDRAELFDHLLATHHDSEPVFMNKARAIFDMAIAVGTATDAHPLRLLAHWITQAPALVLAEAALHAPGPVATFTDGVPLDSLGKNRFALSSWGSFTARFRTIAPFVAQFTRRVVPPSWAQARMSLYITHPLEQLAVASPIIAAALAGLIRGQMRRGERVPVLLLIDEAPTVALQNLPTYLATMGGYGVTALVYAQNLSQLDAVYGPAQARALLSNCLHQLYYVPRDLETARHMSELLGDAEYQQQSIAQHPEVRAGGFSTPPAQTTIPQPRGNLSYTMTLQRRRRLAPEQMLGLSADTVLCLSRQGEQSVTFLGERLDPRS